MSTSNSTAWFTLAGTLSATVITGTIAIVNVLINRRAQRENADRELRRERDKADRDLRMEQMRELRQERRAAYQKYWSSVGAFNQELNTLAASLSSVNGETENFRPQDWELGDAGNVWWNARINARLLAGPEVREALSAHSSMIFDSRTKIFTERRELTDGESGRISVLGNELYDAMQCELGIDPARQAQPIEQLSHRATTDADGPEGPY